jgi:hypothetical protein
MNQESNWFQKRFFFSTWERDLSESMYIMKQRLTVKGNICVEYCHKLRRHVTDYSNWIYLPDFPRYKQILK